MTQSSKQKTKASGSFSSDSYICSPEGKKLCNSSRKVLKEDEREKQSNMSDKITAQLETIWQTLTSVESRLQNLENTFERVSGLEKSISIFGTELSMLNNKTKQIEKTARDVDTAMAAFVNTEIQALKKKVIVSVNKIEELEDKLLYQEVYKTGEKICVSLASPTPTVVSKMHLMWYTSFSKKS